MVKRQMPKAGELLELVQFKKPEFNGRKRRLDAALTIGDLRRIAKRRTPAAAFDYTDGAAEGELSLHRARQAFEDIELHPDILRPAEKVDTSTTILGGAERPAVRHRADRFHPAHAHRRGDRRRVRCGRRWHPVHPVHPGDVIDRSRQGRQTRTAATGFSCMSCGIGRSPTVWSNEPRQPASTL